MSFTGFSPAGLTAGPLDEQAKTTAASASVPTHLPVLHMGTSRGRRSEQRPRPIVSRGAHFPVRKMGHRRGEPHSGSVEKVWLAISPPSETRNRLTPGLSGSGYGVATSALPSGEKPS